MAKLFVFDAYGTLFDVHSALARLRQRAGPEAERCSEIWRAKQLEYTWTLTLAGAYVDFWQLTQRALDYALVRCPSVDPALRGALLETYLTLDAYADAGAALQALKARGDVTAILSNGTSDMLTAAIGGAGLSPLLDAVLSVDAVQCYKPRPEVYQMATDHFGKLPRDVTFVSSNRWDIMGASAFGFRPVWINRTGLPDEYPEQPPEHIFEDLATLTLAL